MTWLDQIPGARLGLLLALAPAPSCGLFVGNPAPQACEDGDDNDGDGLVDEADPQCAESLFSEHVACQDRIDNDLDDLIDEADPACQAQPEGDSEGGNECSDGIDNDGDGAFDVLDPACQGDAFGATESETCRNGLDDDGDGRTDAEEDWGCGQDPSGLSEVGIGPCDDGIDNDEDGQIDLDDSDCLTSAFETPECANGVDDDGDGDIDLADSGCADGHDSSEGSLCSNGRDDDKDGFIDLADPDCGGESSWDSEEVGACEDGVDNDGDFYVDEVDADCYPERHYYCSDRKEDYLPHNPEAGAHDGTGGTCSDGKDNNFNGLIDGEEIAEVCPHGCELEE